MPEPATFWQRVGNFLRSGGDARPGAGPGRVAGGSPDAVGPTRTAPGSTGPATDAGCGSNDPGHAAGRAGLVEPEFGARSAGNPGPRAAALAALPWWQRRQARKMQAVETAQRIGDLADAMQQYFRQQDQRAAELASSLNRVGSTLEQLADTQRSHGDCLQSIAGHTEAASRHAEGLSETLGRVPSALATQAESLRAVARQLEVSQESDTQLMHSLQQFGRAVDTLGSSSTAQVEVLQRLNSAQRDQQEALVTLVREQSRRFLIIIIVAAFLAVAALAALGVTLALRVFA